MVCLIASRDLDIDTGVGKRAAAAGKTAPTVLIFEDVQGPKHALDSTSMASLTRGYPSDITGDYDI